MNRPVLQSQLEHLASGGSLSAAETQEAFDAIMNGDVSAVRIAALLVALRTRGETVEEITGAARSMRAHATPFPLPAAVADHAVDTCGTGGDGLHTLNISTASALLTAACGVPVVKHGNKAISSQSGSADVLTQLGIATDIPPEQSLACLEKAGFCFLLAPRYHPAMKHVAPVRQELRLRTIFNILGPLCNPAGIRRQVIGVYDPRWVHPLAEVLQALGSRHAWVVHGADGMDELTTTGPTHVAELVNGTIREFTVTPETLGLRTAPLDALKGGSAEENAAALEALLQGDSGAYANIVALNCAAALVVSGKTDSLSDGLALAFQALNAGEGYHILETLRTVTKA